MIQDFISQIKTRGLARTNRYEVVIPFPDSETRGMVQVANLFCDAVTLPGASVSTTPMKTFGESREMPYDKIYDNVTMSFYVDSGLEIKRTFEKWMEMIFNTNTRTIGYYNDYITNVEIYVRNVDGAVPYKVTLFEAYPKAINSIQLDTNNKEVMKMTLTLQYKYWTSTTIDVVGARAPQQIRPRTGGVFGGNQYYQAPQNYNTGQGYSYLSTRQGPSAFDPPNYNR